MQLIDKFVMPIYHVSLIYYLMKPLEIFFLIILYTLDKKPENRIASQYLSIQDKNSLHKQLQTH